MFSATWDSIDSMMPETLAAATLTPFPVETETDFELGRTTLMTGMVRRSRPVTLAIRVMPNAPRRGSSAASVSSGGRERTVPP